MPSTKSIVAERRQRAESRQALHNMLTLEQRIEKQCCYHDEMLPVGTDGRMYEPGYKELKRLVAQQKQEAAIAEAPVETTKKLTAEEKSQRRKATDSAKKQLKQYSTK